MLFIKPSYKIHPISDGKTILKDIELAARNCYKSEGKISKDELSAVTLVQKLIKNKHHAMLEFGHNPIFTVSKDIFDELISLNINFLPHMVDLEYRSPKYLTFTENNHRTLISGNMRAYIEFIGAHRTNWAVRMLCEELHKNYPIIFTKELILPDRLPKRVHTFIKEVALFTLDLNERLHHETLTISFICDRGISHELVRHRECSFAQESTRYVNYTHNEHITFILPSHIDYIDETATLKPDVACWYVQMRAVENAYFHLVKQHLWSMQRARSVLNNSVKTEIFVKANLLEWRHLLQLRTEAAAHPDMRALMMPLHKELQRIGGILFNIQIEY